MKDLRLVLGGRIRELRRRQKLSQEELADRAGLHWTYVSDLERGQQTPTVDVVNRLARALGTTLAKFFAPLDECFGYAFANAGRMRSSAAPSCYRPHNTCA